MKPVLLRRFPTRFTTVVLLAAAASSGVLHAETSSEYLLKVYRQTYTQLLELGLRPAEAAAEARKVAQDDANWFRKQHVQGSAKPETEALAVHHPVDGGSTLTPKEPAKAGEPGKPSPFADEQDALPVALKPATARPVVEQALEEVKVALKAKQEGTNIIATPTLDLIYKTAQESRLISSGTALFKSLGNLTNLVAELAGGGTNTAANKKTAIDKETDKVVGQLETLLSTNKFTPKAFLHVGYVTLNPFTFIPQGSPPTHYKLDDGSTSAVYVEFQYNNRWAWNWLESGPANRGELNWVNPFSRQSDLDLQARFGYSFISAATNEVSSIVGGGNVNGEFTVGAPFLKYQNDWVRYSLDVEATYGMSADRSDFDIHSTFMFGVGYHASIDSDFFPGKVLMSLHLGAGAADVPHVIDRTNGYVSMDLGRADFNLKWAVIGVTFETMLPLNASTYLVAGARLYANADPNPWGAYIGISKELGSLRRIFADDPVLGETK